jgi:hypothetical protein
MRDLRIDTTQLHRVQAVNRLPIGAFGRRPWSFWLLSHQLTMQQEQAEQSTESRWKKTKHREAYCLKKNPKSSQKNERRREKLACSHDCNVASVVRRGNDMPT